MIYPYRNPDNGQFGRAIVRNLPKTDDPMHPEMPQIQFCDLSQDREAIINHLGKRAAEFDSFFVIVGDGDYLAVWGMYDIVPTLTKPVYRIF